MLEVEMKFPVRDFAAVETQLARTDAHLNCTRQDIDQYFNAPDRDFAQTDEALRIRRIGSANFVTYKGPKLDARTKTRTEVEVPLADGAATAEAFAQVLTHLGYRPVAVVQKRRRLYHLERNTFSLEVTLDEVQGVGPFVEIETQAPTERLDEARRVVQELATALGLTASERRSYLELLLEAQGKR
ncbi:MAG TPA: class IV adenylate cyclase [Gemmataceae bacterium]|nr:class IV adenylate cyclase [Gemmataceae bacterium]